MSDVGADQYFELGIRKLMYASIALLIISAVGNLPTAVFLVARFVMGRHVTLGPLGFAGSSIVVFLAMLIAAIALLIPSLNYLRRYSSDFSTSATLVKVGYLAGPSLSLVACLATAVISPHVLGGVAKYGLGPTKIPPSPQLLAISALTAVGGLLVIVGMVGIVVACLKLGSQLRIGYFTAAAILFIVGIIANFLRPVAWALLLIATYKALKALRVKESSLSTYISSEASTT